MKSNRNIIHLHLLADNSHHYFGSLASLCDQFDSKQIGIGHGALRNYRITANKPYKNSKCVIRRGILISTANSRKNKDKKNGTEQNNI